MKSVFVVPATKGAIVRDPITKTPLPETGAMVPYDTYWRRRLAHGDVVLKEVDKATPQAEVDNTPQERSAGPSGRRREQ